MKNLILGLLALLFLLFLSVATDLPRFGDNASPASTHLSNHYIEHAYHEAHTPNIVTVMIADYRSFDTFKETVVVFTAGLACFFLLRRPRDKDLAAAKETA